MKDKNKIAIRSYQLRAEASDDGIVEGYASVYNQKTNIGDWFYEIIERGAFDNTDLTDVLLFTNHDMNKIPLARSRKNNGNSTMQLTPDEIGLKMRANIDIENNAEAKTLNSAIQRGDIDGMSFRFLIGDEEWTDLDTDMPTRHIKSISKVIEVSAVNIPAYDGTSIYMRSSDVSLDNERQALDNVLAEKRSLFLLKEKMKKGMI
jgi:HK97 family phage prohead protease